MQKALSAILEKVTGPLRPQFVRASAILIACLLAVGAGAAIGINGHHSSSPNGHISIGPGSASTAVTPGTAATGQGGNSKNTHSGATATTTSTTATTTASGGGTGFASATTTPVSFQPIGPGGSTSTTSAGPQTTATTLPATGSGTTSTTLASTGGPTTTVPASAAPLPPLGTFTYATSGSETAVTTTQDFSNPSTITVAPAASSPGCESETWAASANHTEVLTLCRTTEGLRVLSDKVTIKVTVIGISQTTTQTFNCPPAAIIPDTSGKSVTFTCTSDPAGTTSDETMTFMGPSTVKLGDGTTVAAYRLNSTQTVSGKESGTGTTDYWFSADATLVKEQGSVKATAMGFSYTSSYTLTLQSLTPK